jgi:hypothetical protein
MAIKSKDIIMVSVALIIMGVLLPIGIGLISGAGSQTVEIAGIPEITKVEFKNYPNTNENDTLHFTIVNNAGNDEEHYIWFAKTVNGTDPSESGTAHKVNISGDTTEADVRDSVYSILNALDIEATFQKLLGGWLKIANDNAGDVTDANQNGSSINSITIAQDGSDTEEKAVDTLADSTVITLIGVLVPILAVIGIALGLIPKLRG